MFSRRLTDDDKNWFFDVWHDWQFRNCNWYDFSIIEAKGEWDKIMGGVELEFALLGFHVRWRWNYTVTEKMKGCLDAVAEIKAGTATTRSLKDIEREIWG